MEKISVNGSTTADFLEARDILQYIYHNKEKFVIFKYSGGVLNHSSKIDLPQFNIFLDISFMQKEKASEEDLLDAIDLNEKLFFESCEFDNIVKILSVISVDNRLSTTDDPLLLISSCEVKVGSSVGPKQKEFNGITLSVFCIDAKKFDSIQRKPIHPDNLPPIKMKE